MQSTTHFLLIEPANFGFNKETNSTNAFQNNNTDVKNIQEKALAEFKNFASVLKTNGLYTYIIKDSLKPIKPDAIFPNNWISFHENGNIALYPMFAKNRRLEKNDEDVLNFLHENGFEINDIIDFSFGEQQNIFLEGTGSFILDRENQMAYCSLSERSNEDLFIEFCETMEYFPVIFESQYNNSPIYHTNVLLSITSDFAIVCLDVINKKGDKKSVLNHLKRSNKKIIEITENQLLNFCANSLEATNIFGEKLLICSTNAYNNFTATQKTEIEKTHRFVHSDLSTIENIGGGSARCMLAEIFLPK